MHGARHEVGVSVNKLEQLCADTVSLMDAGVCTGHMLSQIVGKWTWAALVNRPAFSVFNAVYRFIECSGGRVFTVWPSVKHELITMMDLAPLLFSTLSDAWFDKLIATDASESGQGIVAASLDETLSLAEVLQHPDPSQHTWSTIVASSWVHTEHINVLEVRAVSTAIK